MRSDNNLRWFAEKALAGDKFAGLPVTDLPKDYVVPMSNYVRQGQEFNSKFLKAVVENDLQEACVFADAYARENFFEVVRWVQNYLPTLIKGEKGIVSRWCQTIEPIIRERVKKIDDLEMKGIDVPRAFLSPHLQGLSRTSSVAHSSPGASCDRKAVLLST